MDLRPVLSILADQDTLSSRANSRFADFGMPRGAFAPVIAELLASGDGRLQVAVTASGRYISSMRNSLRSSSVV